MILLNHYNNYYNDLTVLSGELTQSGSVAIYRGYCKRYGKVVVVFIQLNSAINTKTNGLTIATIPEGYRPLAESWTIAFHSNGSNGYARLGFTTAGEVKIVNPSGYSVNAGSISYICQ